MVIESEFSSGRPERDFAEYEERDGDFVSLPYSGLSWSLPPENEVYPYIHYFIPIERLAGIRQLGFLSYSGEAPERFFFKPYPHQREDHTWGVTMTADEIGKRSGLGATELTTLRFSALLHDIASPAGGDAIKAIDPEALGEEIHWGDVVGIKGKRLIGKRGVNLNDIDKTIQNEGTLGQILDVADRITYVMKDLYSLLGPHQTRINSDYYLLNLRSILAKNPQIGNIYKEVHIEQDTGDIFFENPDNLFNLLSLRAYLHRDVYLYPTNLGRDMLVGELVRPFYSRLDGSKLTPRKLREMEDTQLMQYLYAQYKGIVDVGSPDGFLHPDLFTKILINQYPKYIKTQSLEDAAREAHELESQGLTILGQREIKPFKAGTNYKVAVGSNILPFSEADPARARELEDIPEQASGVYVFYTNPHDGDYIVKLIQAAREKAA